MILSEDKLRDLVRSVILESLDEANRIRRVRDDEYPSWQVDVDRETLSSIKDSDKEYNEKFNISGKNRADRLKPLKSAHPKAESDLEKFQKELTQKLHKRLKDNGEDITVPLDDNIETTEAVKRRLSDAGIQMGVSGKVFMYGNTKLPPSTLIINLTSAFNCPAKECPLRQGVCYAGKDEKLYTNTTLRNLRNEVTLEKLTVKELLQLLDKYIMSAPVRIKNIRLSESGDFKSQEVVDFCEKMASHLLAKYGIRTTCYTRQKFDFTGCKNMIVNSSIPGEVIKGADRNYLVMFNKKQFEKLPEGLHIDNGKATFKCHCDCYKCNFCYNTKEENGEDPNIRTNVYVMKH